MSESEKPLFDRDRYFYLIKTEGINTAITELHNEMRETELACFDLTWGFVPDLWEKLEALRKFSREIWDFRLAETPDASAKS